VVRGAVDAAQALPNGAVREKVVVVTGATSDLGLETAKRLATQGPEIVMVAQRMLAALLARITAHG
jgi:NADP-dependent 3-hydroxy acid dehydrogenase YdfG